MALKPKFSKKKSYKKRTYRKSMRKGTGVVGGPNTATCTLTTTPFSFQQNTYYQVNIQGLQPLNIGRQTEIAKNYALYRIAKVVCKITPKYDTFIPGAVGVGSVPVEVPYLYWIMNRYGDLPINPIA